MRVATSPPRRPPIAQQYRTGKLKEPIQPPSIKAAANVHKTPVRTPMAASTMILARWDLPETRGSARPTVIATSAPKGSDQTSIAGRSPAPNQSFNDRYTAAHMTALTTETSPATLEGLIEPFSQESRSLPNALVQLQAHCPHCGVAASEKCFSAATFVRQRDLGLQQGRRSEVPTLAECQNDLPLHIQSRCCYHARGAGYAPGERQHLQSHP
jgi:hypothetical protein